MLTILSACLPHPSGACLPLRPPNCLPARSGPARARAPCLALPYLALTGQAWGRKGKLGRLGQASCVATWLPGCVAAWLPGCVNAWLPECLAGPLTTSHVRPLPIRTTREPLAPENLAMRAPRVPKDRSMPAACILKRWIARLPTCGGCVRYPPEAKTGLASHWLDKA